MNSAKHFHIIGPHKTRGRRVQDWLRCVNCGLTTNKKTFQVCARSSDPGGRICEKCFAKVPENCPNDCISWLKFLNPNAMCQICNADTDMYLTCQLCNRYICVKCTVPECYELWGDTGAECITCVSCCPPAARIKPKGAQNYCLPCLTDHTGRRETWPCQQENFADVPLLEALRAGKQKFVESSTRLSQVELPASQPIEIQKKVSAYPSLIFGEEVESPPESLINSSRFDNVILSESKHDEEILGCNGSGGPGYGNNYSSMSKSSSSRIGHDPAQKTVEAENHHNQSPNIGPTNLAQPIYLLEKKIENLLNGTLLSLANATCKNAATLESLQNKVDKLISNNNRSVKFEDEPDENEKGVQVLNRDINESRKSLEDSQAINVGMMRNLLTEQAVVIAKELKKGHQGIEPKTSTALVASSHREEEVLNVSQVNNMTSMLNFVEAFNNTIGNSNTTNRNKQYFHNSRKKNNKGNNHQKKSK